MPVTLELGPNLLSNSRSLFRETEKDQRPHLVTKSCEAGIDCEPIAEQLLLLGTAVLLGSLQALQRITVLSRKDLRHAEESIALGAGRLDRFAGLRIRRFGAQGRARVPSAQPCSLLRKGQRVRKTAAGRRRHRRREVASLQSRRRPHRARYSPSAQIVRWRGRSVAPVREIGGPAHLPGSGSARGRLQHSGLLLWEPSVTTPVPQPLASSAPPARRGRPRCNDRR